MTRQGKVTAIAAFLLTALLAASIFMRHKVDLSRGREATLEDILYLPSGKVVKRLSLGYSNLLADIYWTRAVQYFGARYHVQSTRYDLLAPLLDITTDLDPHLIVAYKTGSIFLSQAVPQGAGQPDKAVALIQKGIRENPEYWRLYFTLGFVHYVDRRDYKAAEEAFDTGSKVPGAMIWMKIMAARMAEHGKDISTAIALWQGILDTYSDKTIRETAFKHLVSLKADADLEELDGKVRAYREKRSMLPRDWSDLVHAGLLAGIPRDPTGAPYKLMPDGTTQVQDPKQFMFLGEARASKKTAN